MPDRPAGAVEGEQDAHVLDASALEAMMAAVLFRPVTEPEKTDIASAPLLVLVQPQGNLGPSAPPTPARRSAEAVPVTAEAVASTVEVASMPVEVSGAPHLDVAPLIPSGRLDASKTARLVVGAADVRNALLRDVDLVNASVPSAETVVAAIHVAAASVPRITPTRNRALDELREAGATPIFDGEVAVVTVETSAGSMALTAAPVPAPRETASSLLSLLEGISGDGAAASAGSTVARTEVRGAVGDKVEATQGEDASGRPVLVSGPAPLTDVRTTAVAATKASAVQSMPVTTQVAETVHAAVLRGDHEIRLLLNPGDLGRIDIRITEQGGVLRLHLDASHGATRELLAREMPVLQQALEARDLRVERIQVSHSSSASADGSGAAWQQGSGGQGQQRERDGSPAWSPVANLAPSDGSQREARRALRIIRHDGTLDRVA